MGEIPQRGYDAEKVPQVIFQVMQFTFLVWLCIAADALVKRSSQMQRRLKDLGGESSEHLSIQIRRHLFFDLLLLDIGATAPFRKVYKIEHHPLPPTTTKTTSF